MRGKLVPVCDGRIVAGITPADAGKTLCSIDNYVLAKDHPRGCGENGYVPKRRQWGIGSPPRMRGKHPRGGCCFCPSRITPADAGKTCMSASQPAIVEDHPRGCGENTKKIL